MPQRQAVNMPPTRLATIFEPDGYNIRGSNVVGRQVAGHTFLQALFRSGVEVGCVTGNARSSDLFQQMAKDNLVESTPEAFNASDYDKLESYGHLFTPDPNIAKYAYSRLRHKTTAYSISGITHTTCTHGTMDMIKELAIAPLMPWDALICTSKSAQYTVAGILEEQQDYLRWRFEGGRAPQTCQLPIIPLGTDTSRFTFSEAERLAARKRLNIAADEVVVLFVGRLSCYTKANPLPMYQAVEEASRRTNKKVTMLECGWFESEDIRTHMSELRHASLKTARYIHRERTSEEVATDCWASADIFMSLSDNIQETFGLTPIEAMAAGLPVIVTDWNGYRETVPDQVAGYRIPTAFPENTGSLAQEYETGIVYGRYVLRAASLTSINLPRLFEVTTKLVENADLRRELGSNGQAHARKKYDWSAILPQYHNLWAELGEKRLGGKDHGLRPRNNPARQAPEKLYAKYPTAVLTPDSTIAVAEEFSFKRFNTLARTAFFDNASVSIPSAADMQAITRCLSSSPQTCRFVGEAVELGEEYLLRLAVLLKMGVINLCDED